MYKVYENIFPFTSKLETYINKHCHMGEPIFNNKINDEKRIQFDLEESDPVTTDLRKDIQHLTTKLGYTGIVNDPVILKSYPFCKRQRLHYDYDISLLKEINECDYPHGIIIGVSNNCRLIVSHDGLSKSYVHFNKGDAVIFRGDTIHAGSEYFTENIRIHAYIDSPKHDRIKNETFYF